jgi:hypothetical protein
LPGCINLQYFCHSRWRNPVRLSKSGDVFQIALKSASHPSQQRVAMAGGGASALRWLAGGLSMSSAIGDETHFCAAPLPRKTLLADVSPCRMRDYARRRGVMPHIWMGTSIDARSPLWGSRSMGSGRAAISRSELAILT